MKKQFKLNIALKNFPVGKIISLECDSDGIPVELYWYRRFLDAKKDNCIEQVETVKPKIKG